MMIFFFYRKRYVNVQLFFRNLFDIIYSTEDTFIVSCFYVYKFNKLETVFHHWKINKIMKYGINHAY